MSRPNIALAGGMYSGKSTIADALTEHGYQRMSFAAPLRNVAALAYGSIDKSADYETMGRDGEPRLVSGRQVLQGVGQSIKDFDRNFWLRCFDRDAERYAGIPLVVDDMRFLFERDWLKAKGWHIVGVDTDLPTRLERANQITGRMPTADELVHESEIEVPKVIAEADIIVDGTEDPYENAATILEDYESNCGA
jgi:dephospho-CoA kinase